MIAPQFCLGKSNQNRVRRNASWRCGPLPTKPVPINVGDWAAIIFRGLFVFHWPSRLQFRRATFSLHYPLCEKLLCPSPLHRLAGFPRFFSLALLRTGTANISLTERALILTNLLAIDCEVLISGQNLGYHCLRFCGLT